MAAPKAQSAAAPSVPPPTQEERAAARREQYRAKHATARASGKERTLTAAEKRARTAARTGQPIPTVKIGAPEKLSVPRIAEALAKTGGLIGPAAQFLQYPRSSVERYIHRYESLQRVREQAKEHALDDTEWALIKAARAGEPWAVQWFLKYQGKDRGYQEVRKTEQDTRVQVEVTYTEDALGAGRPNTTVQQLPPPPSSASADAPVRSADGPHSVEVEIVEAEISYPRGEEG